MLFPFYFYILLLLAKAVIAFKSSKAYGHSKLVVYVGKERHEMDGGSCSVGVAFRQPTIVHCVCVNGVVAFYGDQCLPLSVVAGHNHCFVVPNVPMNRISTVSNPMRAFGNSLILFKDNMESVQQKVYRNVHLTNNTPVDIITINSSWTISNGNGNQRFCLNSSSFMNSMMMDGNAESGFEGVFCTFKNLINYTADIGEIIRGCNDTNSVEILPTECQPILRPTSENVCNDVESHSSITDFPYDNELEFSKMMRKTRQEMENPPEAEVEQEQVENNTPEKVDDIVTSTEKSTGPAKASKSSNDGLKKKYPNMPHWLRKEMERNPNLEKDMKKPTGNSTKKSKVLSATDMTRKMDNLWNNLEQFSHPRVINENRIMLEEIWHYQKSVIKNDLKIALAPEAYPRKTHPTEAMISKLLYISKSIMAKLCPEEGTEENTEHLDLSMHVFLSLSSKIFDWNIPRFTHVEFNRIEASLMHCLDTASRPPVPGAGDGKCEGSAEGDSNLIPKPLRSEGYDPIIETVWKIFVAVHSYCYKTFDRFYSDHHKYTTIITPLFGKQLEPFWIRISKKQDPTSEDDLPYGGILGDISKILGKYDRCTYGARLSSNFPFHMTRPISSAMENGTKKKDDNKESLGNDATSTESPSEGGAGVEGSDNADGSRRRKRAKRETVNDAEWKRQRTVFGGLGYCLKKYNEPRERLRQYCSVALGK